MITFSKHFDSSAWLQICQQLAPYNATLIAVSKTQPASNIAALYELGQRHFGENYVQELLEKQPQLPADIHWHFIGHLQRNKAKYIAPFVHTVHSIDSLPLLAELNRQAEQNNRIIRGLWQVHIAKEETKFGLLPNELRDILEKFHPSDYPFIQMVGLMGMASFTKNIADIQTEFGLLQQLYEQLKPSQPDYFCQLSMGMSSDYPIALQHGSTMVRIGSLLFGDRPTKH